jgi:tetratricopeptide (TPR) repeat protein
MSDYTIAIKQDSPLWRLYQKLKTDGVKDADLDTGYPQTDYVKKSRKTVHQGDHKIEATEVLNYALEHYERYQLALKETTGYIVPWSLDDLNPATDFDAKIRDNVALTITEFKRSLSANGLAEGTDRYNELLALSLYSFVLAVKTTGASGVVGLKGADRELKGAGVNGIVDRLVKSGGLGLANKKDCDLEAAALGVLVKACGACTEQSKVLYAVFRAAGLQPKFFYVKPDEDGFRGRALVPHKSVGVKFGDKTRIFDPAMQEPDAVSFYKKSGYFWWFEETGAELLAAHYFNLGGDLIERGDPDRAVAAFKTAGRINPNYPDIHFILGNIYIRTHNLDRALAEYKLAVKADPRDGRAYNNLGNVYRDLGYRYEQSDQAEAVRLFQLALAAYDLARANGVSVGQDCSVSLQRKLNLLGL